MISKIASSVPYMIGVGNHEYLHKEACNNGGADVSGVAAKSLWPHFLSSGDDSNGEGGAPMFYRFDAPTNGHSIFWYSFDFNMVHFVVLSSEHNFSANAPGGQWLENDLKNVDRERTPWLIVNIHRPLYESEDYPDDTAVSAVLVEWLEPMFLEYGVDLVLGGHYHAYERTFAVKNGHCAAAGEGGIVHLTIGSAGYPLDDGRYRDVEWSAFRDHTHWGFGRFYVEYTSLKMEFVAHGAGVIDSVVLKKPPKNQKATMDAGVTVNQYQSSMCLII